MRICTICARGGSKGIPDKNLRLLMGRPLIGHSVRQALDLRTYVYYSEQRRPAHIGIIIMMQH